MPGTRLGLGSLVRGPIAQRLLDKTVAAQNSATNDVPLETLTNNDGFIIGGLHRFNAINLRVDTASVGGATRTLEYTKDDGTWAAITNAYIPPPTGAEWVTSGSKENLILFEPPLDWGKSVAAHGTNLPLGYYCIRVRATTAGATAGLASGLTIASVIVGFAGLASTGLYGGLIGEGEYCFNCLADGLVMVNSTPASQNLFRVNVRTMG